MGERRSAGNVRVVAWAVWLAIPIAVTLLVALWTWVRSRPPRQPSTAKAMREHSDYLDALAASARHVSRGAELPPKG